MKFIKLTKFILNPELVNELADKISGTEDSWQTLHYEQYPSIMQMLSDNNLVSIREINISTRLGPVEKLAGPINEYDTTGNLALAPFRVYIPLAGVNTTLVIGDESMVIDSPTAAIATEEMTSSVPIGASHMLRITLRDSEVTGIYRYITDPANKMAAFVKYNGLV